MPEWTQQLEAMVVPALRAAIEAADVALAAEHRDILSGIGQVKSAAPVPLTRKILAFPSQAPERGTGRGANSGPRAGGILVRRAPRPGLYFKVMLTPPCVFH